MRGPSGSIIIQIPKSGICGSGIGQRKIKMAEESSNLPEVVELAGWNQPCLEEHLAEIATSIVEWREISPFLGLTEAESTKYSDLLILYAHRR